MSLETIVRRLTAAFDMLSRRESSQADPEGAGQVHPRPSHPAPEQRVPAPDIGKPGFNEEALPWIGAVHRFAMSLTKEADSAVDLVQETYLRAYRSWDRFESGTNCRAWLFRICRNVFLHDREKASTRREIRESDLGDDVAITTVRAAFEHARMPAGDPADLFADQILDARVVNAIDSLPDDYRDTLVLSDLGDLSYGEIAEVLGVPVGTVKSRLFRARQQLQIALVDFAKEAGYVQGGER